MAGSNWRIETARLAIDEDHRHAGDLNNSGSRSIASRRPMRGSERGKRTIVLDDTLVALLLRMREPYQRLIAGAPEGVDVDLSLVRIPNDWLIFPSPDGEPNAPRHPDSVTKQFTKRAEEILGFSIRLHGLRVSHGTWLLDQGTPVHTVAKRLGHDPSVLLKVYAKWTQKGDASAAEKIGLLTKGLSIGPS